MKKWRNVAFPLAGLDEINYLLHKERAFFYQRWGRCHTSAGEANGRAGNTKGKWRRLQDPQEGTHLSPKSQLLLAVGQKKPFSLLQRDKKTLLPPFLLHGQFCETKPLGFQELHAHHFMKMHPRKDWTSHSAEELLHCNNYQIPIDSVYKFSYCSNTVTHKWNKEFKTI